MDEGAPPPPPLLSEADGEAVRRVEEGSKLAQHEATGKKKNDRVFWVSVQRAELCWDKKKTAKKPNKGPQRLLEIHDGFPSVRDARALFNEHAGGNGLLGAAELPTLYQAARGAKLGKKDLKKALAAADPDATGEISFEHFEAWWSSAQGGGGPLEAGRALGMTIKTEATELLLLAPDEQTKALWLAGVGVALGVSEAGGPGAAPAAGGEEETQQDYAQPTAGGAGQDWLAMVVELGVGARFSRPL